MMNFEKPMGYDEVDAGNGEYTPIQLGGHKLIVKKIEEVTSQSGYNYLKAAWSSRTTCAVMRSTALFTW